MTYIHPAIRPLFALTLYVFMSGLALAAPLSDMRATWNKSLASIEKQSESAITVLQGQYSRALAAFESKCRKDGDLDALIAVRTEIKRFNDQEVVNAAETQTGHIQQLQKGYIDTIEKIPYDRATRILNLRDQYDRSLESQQTALTKSDHLEQALALKTERTTINQLPKVTAAQFLVAEWEADHPTPTPSEPTTTPSLTIKTPIAAPKNPATVFTGDNDDRIKKRFKEFVAHLEDSELSEAIDYISPAQRMKSGDAVIKMQLNFISQSLKFIENNPAMDYRLDSISVAEDGQTSTVIPKVLNRNTWKDQAPQTWVLIQGDWYMETPTKGQGAKQDINQRLPDLDRPRRSKKKRRK